jgi:hypothetical protein
MPDGRATELDASIGGFTGDSFRVLLDGETLVHEHLGYGYQPQERRTLQPSTEKWEEFWAAVDEVGVWTWEPRYADESILDGTGWSIRFARGTHQVNSQGTNAAPRGLRELCDAISRLAGGPFW